MQIPSSAIAASVASVASNTKSELSTAPQAAVNSPIQVEKSAESSADRDAQGQADGMGSRNSRKQAQATPGASEPSDPQLTIPAPTLPDEPPSQLDLVG
jgi:hypothetical protein